MVASSNMAIAKPQLYESKRIALTSPILHIGGTQQVLNPFEFVQTLEHVYVPDEEALAKALYQKGGSFLQDYVREIDGRRDLTRLLKQAFGQEWIKAKDPEGNPIFPPTGISKKWAEEVTDLRPMIRNGMGYRYIPGTSIKGAMRTAIAHYLLKYADRYQVAPAVRVSEIEKKLREKLNAGDLARKKTFLDDEVFMESLFSDFGFTQPNSEARIGPNTDFMRAVHISDSKPLRKREIKTPAGKPVLKNNLVVAEAIVSSRYEDGKAKFRASIYVEMVVNVQTEFTISLDYEMLSWFRHNRGMKIPFATVDDLLQICLDFAREQWRYEFNYWQRIRNNSLRERDLDFDLIRDFYKAEKCPYDLRIGWASGIPGTTIGLRLQKQLLQEIRDECGIKAPGFEAPKSRRTIVNQAGDIRYAPGWVKFKVLGQNVGGD